MSFGSRIIQLRKEKRVSRQELADALGIPYTTLRNYEKDEREAGHKLLSALADYFGVTVDFLLGLEQQKPPTSQELHRTRQRETAELLNYFKDLSDADRAMLLRIASLAAGANQSSRPATADELDELTEQWGMEQVRLEKERRESDQKRQTDSL